METTETPVIKKKTKQLAYSRRQKENDTFAEIAQTLPVSADGVKELDKASILRVAIHYIKLRQFMDQGDGDILQHDDNNNNSIAPTTTSELSQDMIKALDGFLLIVSGEGFILYSSDSISDYLGLRQVDVIGHHIQDLVHPQDYHELMATFPPKGLHYTLPAQRPPMNNHGNYLLRMRCSFTPTVRTLTRCSNFKPIYLNAHFKYSTNMSPYGASDSFSGMIATCKLAGVSSVREICVGTSFRTKHSLDLKYTFLDTRIRWLVGYDPAELLGKKGYEYFHPLDLTATSHCHTKLLNNGRSASPSYRFLTKWGDYVWVRTCSEVSCDPVTHLPVSLTLWTWIVSPQESVECNTAYESHYKTPFKVPHADDPLAGDTSPSQLSSQSNSPASSHIKSETTSSCGSPDPPPLSSTATTPLSVNQEVPEAAGCSTLPMNTPPCTPLNSSNTPCHKASTPNSAHQEHRSIISMKTTLKMAPLSLGAISNTTTTLDDLLLPVVADGYKYPTPSPTDSAGRGDSYSPTEDTHMTSLHHTNLAGGELLLSPDSQPALSPDMIGCKRGYRGGSLDSQNSNSLERYHGNRLDNYRGNSLDSIKDDPLLLGDGNLDDAIITNSNLSTCDLGDVSVSDILNEVQASLEQPTTHCGPTSQPPVPNNTISFGDITNSSNLFGFTMMSSSTNNSANRMLRDPQGVRQRYAGVSPSSVSKHRSPDKEAAIRSIVDSFHQAEQMVPANELLPTYTM